jgi:hypothetical protein
MTLSAEVWWEEAEECMRSGAFAEAAVRYADGFGWTGEFAPPASATNARALALLRAARAAEVLALAAGSEDDGQDPDPPTRLGLALLDLGNVDPAVHELENACLRGARREVRALAARVGLIAGDSYPRPAAPPGYWVLRERAYADKSEWVAAEVCRRLQLRSYVVKRVDGCPMR